jgi:transcriptional regulator with XRE-family HTH domain
MSEGHGPPARALYVRAEREWRHKGWTISDVATRTGLSRATIYRLRAGKRAPLADTVNKLADLLGIDRDEAYELGGLTSSPMETVIHARIEGDEERENEIRQDEEGAVIITVDKDLPEEERRRIARLAQQMAREMADMYRDRQRADQ